MGLLSKKSVSNDTFKFVQTLICTSPIFHFNGISERDSNYPIDDCLWYDSVEKYGFKTGVEYSVNSLIDLKLGLSNYDVNIRKFLLKRGLINEEDRQYLLSIGFNEDEIGQKINYNIFTNIVNQSSDATRAYNVLYRSGLSTLDMLLLTNVEDLKKARNCGDRVLSVIRRYAQTLGYPLRGESIYDLALDRESFDSIKEEYHRLINVRKDYFKEREQIDLKISEVDESIKKLLKENKLTDAVMK